MEKSLLAPDNALFKAALELRNLVESGAAKPAEQARESGGSDGDGDGAF